MSGLNSYLCKDERVTEGDEDYSLLSEAEEGVLNEEEEEGEEEEEEEKEDHLIIDEEYNYDTVETISEDSTSPQFIQR